MHETEVVGISSLIAPLSNVVILVGLLFYFLRQPVKSFVSNRRKTIETELHSVSDRLKKAQIKFEEYSSKLNAIESETTAMRLQMKAELQSMQVKILTEAKQLAQRIEADASQASLAALEDMKFEIRKEYVRLVIALAEKNIKEKLTVADKERYQKQFSTQVGFSS